ncbi:ComF family protein [Roseibium aggregatum]|uniref:ComF family protein n=1 Tax=Roseibium aggregatum TaxID=187304 RepID=A0A926P0X7_9HYPH|nr:ComF family protein [Roseibium aggregatum]MBD1549164.1 ComF family protein [Roseibium aggregatum]
MAQVTVAGKRLFGLTGRWGRRAAGGLLDLLLPPRCLACTAVIDQPGGLCAECWRDMPFLEAPWCARYGTPFAYDIGKDGLSPRAIADPPVFERARAVAHYSGPARDMVMALKFSGRRDLAGPMGCWMARAGREFLDKDSVIVPVPLHRIRLWQRRFNQSADLARAVAGVSGGTYVPELLRRKRRTRQQVGLDAAARRQNVRGAFGVREDLEEFVYGKQVVLVDDVLTTGATVSACTKVLKSAGAAGIDVLTFANADPAGVLS